MRSPKTPTSHYRVPKLKPPTPDNVNHPPHYTAGGVECIDAIRAALGHDGFVAFLRGQVIKYTWRLPHKGRPIEDARKAAWYQAKLIEELENASK